MSAQEDNRREYFVRIEALRRLLKAAKECGAPAQVVKDIEEKIIQGGYR